VNSLIKKALLFFILGLSFFLPLKAQKDSWAINQEECERRIGKEELSLEDLRECEAIFKDLFQKAKAQERSLESEIRRFNSQIALTNTRIIKTQEEIKSLEKEIKVLLKRVDLLDQTLDEISSLLIKRIEETYKKRKIDPFLLIFSSENFSQFITRFKYFRAIQAHDQKLLFQMTEARKNYKDQKEIKEKKQKELETAHSKLKIQKANFAQQKASKERFLVETQGSKLRLEELLNTTRAEVEAIQRIIAGEGECSEAGKVNEGERVATLISGPSACSTGTHLHFEVRENAQVRNPFSYLRHISLVDDSGGDPNLASGSWNWPLNEPIEFNQGYGSDTASIRARIVWYNFHTGIDLVSNDLVVKAVKTGALSRCAISCGGGSLRYVKVDHDDSNFDTYYLHVNY
jgi:peptidoglycan hydrolase CwlO-like protein